MEAKKKGSPVPEPAEVQAPHARRPLRPVMRAMAPIGIAAGLSVAGISLWAAAEPQDPSCERPGSTSASGPSSPFEIVRHALRAMRKSITPKPVASPAGAIPVSPPITPTATVALAGEPPPVIAPTKVNPVDAGAPKGVTPPPTIPPHSPTPSVRGGLRPVEPPAAPGSVPPAPKVGTAPTVPRRDVEVDGGLKSPKL